MKIPLQEKIAELERRIADLEKRQRTNAVSTQTITRVDMQPEMDRVFKAFDRLIAKCGKVWR